MGCNIRAKNQKILVLDNRNIHVLVKIAPKIGSLSSSNELIFVIHYNNYKHVSFLLHPISLVGNDIKYLYNKITIKLKRPNYTRCIFFHNKAFTKPPFELLMYKYETTLLWSNWIEGRKPFQFDNSSLAIYYDKRFDFYIIPHTFINLCRTLD